MEKRYYLMSGTERYGSSLSILVDGKYKKDFEDISTLDLATMAIKKKEAKSVLGEYNPCIGKDSMFYIIGYPFSGECRAFAPIFDYNKPNLEEYYNNLRRYAEERNYNVQNNRLKELDIESDGELLECLYHIFKDMIDNKIKDLYGDKSVICKEAKELIARRNTKKNSKYETLEYLHRHQNEIIFLYSRYTELRKLMLEYILYKSGIRCDIGTFIWPTKYWDNNGIYGYIPASKQTYCRQLELNEFGPVPGSNIDPKKRRR